MTPLDGWTPGHRPTRCLELPGGGIQITHTRPGMDDVHQHLTRDDYDRLRARRTLPPLEPSGDET